jgi:hypothetical protein
MLFEDSWLLVTQDHFQQKDVKLVDVALLLLVVTLIESIAPILHSNQTTMAGAIQRLMFQTMTRYLRKHRLLPNRMRKERIQSRKITETMPITNNTGNNKSNFFTDKK